MSNDPAFKIGISSKEVRQFGKAIERTNKIAMSQQQYFNEFFCYYAVARWFRWQNLTWWQRLWWKVKGIF